MEERRASGRPPSSLGDYGDFATPPGILGGVSVMTGVTFVPSRGGRTGTDPLEAGDALRHVTARMK